jgi:hypothetical protein
MCRRTSGLRASTEHRRPDPIRPKGQESHAASLSHQCSMLGSHAQASTQWHRGGGVYHRIYEETPMNGSSSESGSGHRSRGPAGPEWVRPQAVWFLVWSALSSSLVAGPVGKRETRFLRFPLFHRAVLVSFFLDHLFLSLRITHGSAGFSAAGRKQATDSREHPIGCASWGCGSLGPRSLVDRSV